MYFKAGGEMVKKIAVLLSLSLLLSAVPVFVPDISSELIRQEREEPQWPMFAHDRFHTGVGNELEKGIATPLKKWDRNNVNPSIDSWGSTIGNFTNNINFESAEPFSTNSFVYAYDDDDDGESSVFIIDGTTGKVMWEREFNTLINATPTLAYMNGNDMLDIIIAESDGVIYAYEPDIIYDGSNDEYEIGSDVQLWSSDDIGTIDYSSPVLAYIDNDDTLDVIIGSSSGDSSYVYAIDGENGETIWYSEPIQGNLISTPAIVETGSDCNVAVTVFDDENNILHVYLIDSDGTTLWDDSIQLSVSIGTIYNTIPSPAVGDVDNDGQQDIIVLSPFEDDNGKIYLYDQDGDLLWNPVQVDGQFEATPAIANLDADSALEVIVASWSADFGDVTVHIYAYDGSNGNNEWEKSINDVSDTYSERAVSSPVLQDVDKDGILDVIYITLNGYVYALDGENGAFLWDGNYYDISDAHSNIASSPALGDVDLDGFLDVVIDGAMISNLIPDLAIKSEDITVWPEEIVEGKNVSVRAKVYNLGTDEVSDARVEFYDNNEYIGYDTVSIPANASRRADIDYTFTEGGMHTIKVVVDPDDEIQESKENNNIASKDFQVSSQYGVELNVQDEHQTMKPGETLMFEIEVKNIGKENDTIDLLCSNIPDEWTAMFEESNSTTLSTAVEGESKKMVHLSVTSDADAMADDYLLVVEATSQNDSAKSDSVNLTVTIAGEYEVDLACDDLEKNVMPGGYADYTVTVTNYGNTNDDIELDIYGVSSAGWEAFFTENDDDHLLLQNLSIKEARDVVVRVTAPESADDGDYEDITVIGRSVGDGSKTDELEIVTTVIKPDLVVEGLTFFRGDGEEVDGITKHPVEDETTTIGAYIRNKDDIYIGEVKVRFTYNSTTIDVVKAILSENETKLVITTIVIEEPGNYTFKVEIDPYDEIPEDNKSNNNMEKTIYVKSKMDVGDYIIEGKIFAPDGVTEAENANITITNLRTQMKNYTSSGAHGIFTFNIYKMNQSYWDGDKIEIFAERGVDNATVIISVYSEDAYRYIEIVLQEPPRYGIEMIVDKESKNVSPGASVDYNITVFNTGNRQDNFTFTYEKSEAWSVSIIPDKVFLDVNENTTVILRVTAPPDAKAGIKNIVQVIGASEGNISKTATLITTTIVSRVYELDIEITDNNQTVENGGTAVYHIIVKNEGNGPDTVTLTVEPYNQEWEVRFENELQEIELNIEAFSSYSIELLVTSPRSTEEGSYITVLTGKSQGGLERTVNVITVVERVFYNVSLKVVDSTHTILAGKETVFNLSIENTGNASETFELSYSYTDEEIDNWTITFIEGESVQLDVGEIVERTMKVSTIKTSPEGSYTIEVKATSVKDGNAFDTADVRVIIGSYGVELSVDSDEKYAEPYSQVEFEFEIRNSGDFADSFTFDVYNPKEESWHANLSDEKAELSPKDKFILTLTITNLNLNSTEVEVIFTARSESDDDVYASKNVSVYLTITYGVMISAKDITKTTSESTTFPFKVKNTGNVKDTINLDVSQIDGWSIYLSSSRLNLNAGEESDVSLIVRASADASGDYYIDVTATSIGDPTKVDSETFVVSIIKPDLTLKNLQFSKRRPVEGEKIEISVIVENIGEADVNETITVTFYYDNSTIMSKNINSLLSDGEATLSINWTAVKGEHEIKVKVDPKNNIVEGSEDNNLVYEKITVISKEEGAKGTELIIVSGIIVVVIIVIAVLVKKGYIKV